MASEHVQGGFASCPRENSQNDIGLPPALVSLFHPNVPRVSLWFLSLQTRVLAFVPIWYFSQHFNVSILIMFWLALSLGIHNIINI